MKAVKGLFFGFLVAVMLLLASSCGVPSPSTPSAIATPATETTISRSDTIVITFSTAMSPDTLVLSGNAAFDNAAVAWSETNIVNDTLTINPGVGNGDAWPAGSLTLIVDVISAKGAIFPTLTLDYVVVALVPSAVAVPASTATIIGSDFIVILFSESMDITTLRIQGDMAAESDNGTWSKTSSENDTLVIRPSSAWSGNASTLVINADSIGGASLPTLSLFYIVDTTVPVITNVLPADNTAINGSVPIVISFSIAMKPATLSLSGSLVSGFASDGGVWSSSSNADDTLTISPIGAWVDGVQTLTIDADAINGKALQTSTFSYTVDTTSLIPGVTPVSGSLITGSKSIIIDFGEAMDIATLVASGTLWVGSDKGVWSVNDDILTISPAPPLGALGIPGAWLAGPIDLTLDIADLVGNSLVPLALNYTVDTGTPTIALLGADPVNLLVGDSYTDDGATATDDVDLSPVITAKIITVNPVNTGAVGNYIVTYNVSDTAGNPAVEVTRRVNVQVGAASAGTSTITASPTSIVADGSSTSTITVQAKDGNNNNLTTGGDTVVLSTTGSAIISAVTDNTDGTYTATVTNTVAEDVTITGTIAGNAITGTATVTFF